MLSAALAWLERSVALAPAQPRSKRLVAGFGAYSRRITEPDAARVWFGERRCNLALICGTGPGGGLTALDFDDMAAYRAWCTVELELAATRTDLTRRGAHVYFWGPLDPHAVPGAQVIRTGTILVAPSVHPTGVIYRAVDPDAPVLPAPARWAPVGSAAVAPSLLSKSPLLRDAESDRDRGLVAEIKAAFPVLALAETVTQLHTRDQRWYHGRCPWHQDRDPSFWVDAARGLWGCFACDVIGDVVNLFAGIHGQSVARAIDELARCLREGRPCGR